MEIILSGQILQWFYYDQKEDNRAFNTILVCIHINSLVTGSMDLSVSTMTMVLPIKLSYCKGNRTNSEAKN